MKKRQKLSPRVEWMPLHRAGGPWLGVARTWMQTTKFNGSSVTWGSDEVLRPGVTVREIEELAAMVAAATIERERFLALRG